MYKIFLLNILYFLTFSITTQLDRYFSAFIYFDIKLTFCYCQCWTVLYSCQSNCY